MVGVAQSVERRIVAPEVVGSIPIVHPMSASFVLLRAYLLIIALNSARVKGRDRNRWEVAPRDGLEPPT